jgi:hypothetical protein
MLGVGNTNARRRQHKRKAQGKCILKTAPDSSRNSPEDLRSVYLAVEAWNHINAGDNTLNTVSQGLICSSVELLWDLCW